jgi:hypothetical protein
VNEIDNTYIDSALTSVIKSLGVKDYVDDEHLNSLVKNGKIQEAIKEIAQYLSLPIEVNLTFLSEGSHDKSKTTNHFNSTDLVITDTHGHGTSSITAQVHIPFNLPILGSQKMVNFPIAIEINDISTHYPLTFIAVIAHELSHVLLHSILHMEKNNEYFTDLTAMALGFAHVMLHGRKIEKRITHDNEVTITTTRYGYLSDDNFGYAYGKIDLKLMEYDSRKSEYFNETKYLLAEYPDLQKDISQFQEYLEKIDKQLDHEISPTDSHWLSIFHQPDYIQDYEFTVKKYKKALDNFHSYLQGINHYYENTFEEIEKQRKEIDLIDDELNKQFDRVRGAIDILKKYVI